MKIELTYNEGGDLIGYHIVPETLEERRTLGEVRDLLFFGFDDTHIKYDGLVTDGDGTKQSKNLERLKFIQKRYQRCKIFQVEWGTDQYPTLEDNERVKRLYEIDMIPENGWNDDEFLKKIKDLDIGQELDALGSLYDVRVYRVN